MGPLLLDIPSHIAGHGEFAAIFRAWGRFRASRRCRDAHELFQNVCQLADTRKFSKNTAAAATVVLTGAEGGEIAESAAFCFASAAQRC